MKALDLLLYSLFLILFLILACTEANQYWRLLYLLIVVMDSVMIGYLLKGEMNSYD